MILDGHLESALDLTGNGVTPVYDLQCSIGRSLLFIREARYKRTDRPLRFNFETASTRRRTALASWP